MIIIRLILIKELICEKKQKSLIQILTELNLIETKDDNCFKFLKDNIFKLIKK